MGEPLLVSIEIPQAGRALSAALARHFGADGGRRLGAVFEGPDLVRAAIRGLAENAGEARFAHGQVPYGAVRAHVPPDTRYVTLLRDPLQRTLAQFRSLQPETSTPEPAGGGESLEDAAARVPHLFDNTATRLLSGLVSPLGELPPEALDRAMENLDAFALVGVAERLDETLPLLATVAGADPATRRMRRPVEEDLDPETRAFLERCNAFDLELYAYANERLDRAVAPRPAHLRRQLVAFVDVPATAVAAVRPHFREVYGESGIRTAGNIFRSEARVRAKLMRLGSGPREDVAAVIGQAPFGLLAQSLPSDTRYVVFLRDPAARAVRHAEELGEEHPELFLDNIATRLLCGLTSPFDELPPRALDKAKRNLRERFALVGIVERLDESLVLLARLLGCEPRPTRRMAVAVDVPQDKRAFVEERDALDRELYAYALELLDAEVAEAGEGFGAAVEELKKRAAEASAKRLRSPR